MTVALLSPNGIRLMEVDALIPTIRIPIRIAPTVTMAQTIPKSAPIACREFVLKDRHTYVEREV